MKVKLTENKSLCVLPFSHIFVSPQGEFKPCCRFQGSQWSKVEGTIVEAFNGKEWGKLRSQMLKGENVAGCIRCYQEEEANKKSLRQRYNTHQELGLHKVSLNEPELIWLEIPFSNQCNLACRMCDSRYSTKWIFDELKLYDKTYAKKQLYKFDVDSLKEISDNLVHVKVTGGEPFFDKKHLKFLELIGSSKNSENIFLNYSTNLTIFPNEKVLKYWEKFKKIELALSLDSIHPEETYYMRYPSNGDNVIQNVEKFFKLAKENKNIDLILRSTVGALNIYSMPETLLWWERKKRELNLPENRIVENPTHLTFPDYLSATALSKEQKKRVRKKFESAKLYLSSESLRHLDYLRAYMDSVTNYDLHTKMIEKLNELDVLRQESAKKTFPHYNFS